MDVQEGIGKLSRHCNAGGRGQDAISAFGWTTFFVDIVMSLSNVSRCTLQYCCTFWCAKN